MHQRHYRTPTNMDHFLQFVRTCLGATNNSDVLSCVFLWGGYLPYDITRLSTGKTKRKKLSLRIPTLEHKIKFCAFTEWAVKLQLWKSAAVAPANLHVTTDSGLAHSTTKKEWKWFTRCLYTWKNNWKSFVVGKSCYDWSATPHH